MNMTKIKMALILAGLALATGCSKNPDQQYAYDPVYQQPQQQYQQPMPQQQYQQQPQVVYQQAPQQASGGHDGTDMLMAGAVGMMAGHMLSGGGSSSYGNSGVGHTTVINKTIINHAPQTVYRPAPAVSRPIARTYRSSSSSSFRRR